MRACVRARVVVAPQSRQQHLLLLQPSSRYHFFFFFQSYNTVNNTLRFSIAHECIIIVMPWLEGAMVGGMTVEISNNTMERELMTPYAHVLHTVAACAYNNNNNNNKLILVITVVCSTPPPHTGEPLAPNLGLNRRGDMTLTADRKIRMIISHKYISRYISIVYKSFRFCAAERWLHWLNFFLNCHRVRHHFKDRT